MEHRVITGVDHVGRLKLEPTANSAAHRPCCSGVSACSGSACVGRCFGEDGACSWLRLEPAVRDECRVTSRTGVYIVRVQGAVVTVRSKLNFETEGANSPAAAPCAPRRRARAPRAVPRRLGRCRLGLPPNAARSSRVSRSYADSPDASGHTASRTRSCTHASASSRSRGAICAGVTTSAAAALPAIGARTGAAAAPTFCASSAAGGCVSRSARRMAVVSGCKPVSDAGARLRAGWGSVGGRWQGTVHRRAHAGWGAG